ncbi:CBS domain-containing protein [Candidatus Micrarchaeota archaeon]|nr:CBS domain-containing protein [Candidatus Micrarchaeota archaeon]
MLPSTQEIRARRKKLGLTQSQLAKESGVSQSLIAKIESNAIDASYSNTVRIFEALERLERKTVVRAGQIMSAPVVFVHASDSVGHTLKLMRKRDFSQLPVFDVGHPVGSISDKTVLEKISAGASLEDLSFQPVGDVMEEAFPVVDESTPLPAVSSLLNYHFAVLVRKKNKVAGIITKSNLLDLVGR